MKNILKMFLTILILCLNFDVKASQDQILGWSNFLIQSAGIKDTGPIKLSGTLLGKGVSSLKIEAFDKKVELNALQLEKLKGFSMNGASLTYGCDFNGKCAVYIAFLEGNTYSNNEIAIIYFYEDGSINITLSSENKVKNILPCIGKDGLPDLPQEECK